MSNKNNSNNTRKSKRTKVDSNPIKKPVNNTPKKVNDPELYCNNCGVFLDNIKNYHYVFSDDFGELDVCGKCFDELNEENSNIPTNSFNPSLNPNIPSLSLSKGIVSNGLRTDLPKIRLVFLNPTNSNCDGNTVGNDSNTNNSTQKTLEIEKTNDRNKNKDKNEDKNKNDYTN